MKIGKLHIRFSKIVVFALLVYFIRLSEFVIDFSKVLGDTYSLTALIGMWGGAVTAVVSFYIWMSKNENVPWNEWQAKATYGPTCEEDLEPYDATEDYQGDIEDLSDINIEQHSLGGIEESEEGSRI